MKKKYPQITQISVSSRILSRGITNRWARKNVFVTCQYSSGSGLRSRSVGILILRALAGPPSRTVGVLEGNAGMQRLTSRQRRLMRRSRDSFRSFFVPDGCERLVPAHRRLVRCPGLPTEREGRCLAGEAWDRASMTGATRDGFGFFTQSNEISQTAHQAVAAQAGSPRHP